MRTLIEDGVITVDDSGIIHVTQKTWETMNNPTSTVVITAKRGQGVPRKPYQKDQGE